MVKPKPRSLWEDRRVIALLERAEVTPADLSVLTKQEIRRLAQEGLDRLPPAPPPSRLEADLADGALQE